MKEFYCPECKQNVPRAAAEAHRGNCPGCWLPLETTHGDQMEVVQASAIPAPIEPDNIPEPVDKDLCFDSPEEESQKESAPVQQEDTEQPPQDDAPGPELEVWPENEVAFDPEPADFVSRSRAGDAAPVFQGAINQSTEIETDNDIVALQVNPVSGITRDLESITQLMNTLGSVASPIAFELSGTNQRRYLIVRCQRRFAPVVRGQITGIYGSPEILDITASHNDPARIFSSRDQHRSWTHLTLEKSEALPIRTFREIAENDTILNLLSTLYGLEETESGQIQVVIHGKAKTDWSAKYRQELLEIRRRRMGQISMVDYFRIMSLVAGVIGSGYYFLAGQWLGLLWLLMLGIILIAFGSPILFNRSDLEWSESLEEAVARKIDQPGYRVEIRLAASGATQERVAQLLDVMAGAFRVFSQESGNGFTKNQSPGFIDPSEITETPERTFILGDVELASIWHLPIEVLPDMMQVKKYDHTLLDSSVYLEGNESHTFEVGVSRKDAGREIVHRLPLDAIGHNSMILLGQTGVGKSTFLEHAICAIAEDPERSLVVIDPHSDMVERLIEILPPSRADDIIFLDFGDHEMLPGLNLLDVTLFDGDPEKTAAAFFEVARALYGKYWGPRMEVPFEKTISALTLANTTRPPQKQLTLIDAIYLILMKKEGRKRYLEKILPSPNENVQSKAIINYFEYELDTRAQSFNDQVISPVLSKLRPFESNSQLLAVFGQPRSTINPIHAIRDGKILLVRTGMEDIDSSYSNFIGSVFLKLADEAVLSQKPIPKDLRRRVTIVVDESQQFPGYDFGLALSLHRKYGGNFMLTTQGVSFMGRARTSADQERPTTYQEVMSNSSTKVVFRLAGHDARVLTDTDFFNEMEPQNLINLPAYHAFIHFAGKKVWGPFLVSTKPPREEVPGLRDAILERRPRYCLPKEHLLEISNKTINAILGRIASEEYLKEDQKDLSTSSPPEVADAEPIPEELGKKYENKAVIDRSKKAVPSPEPEAEQELGGNGSIGDLYSTEDYISEQSDG